MKKENEMLHAMVSWFRENYPEISPLMVYVPRANKILEKKGASYGSADLIILYPTNGYSSLCVQVLYRTERNSDQHKRWRVLAENDGNKCVTIRDFVEFTEAVEEYLSNSPYA